jgi:hypothetical protein
MRSCSLRQQLTTRLVLEMIGTMLLVSSTGCSFIFVHNREVPPESPPDCTRSRLAPAVDFVVAAGAVAVALWGKHASAQCQPNCESLAPAYEGFGLLTAAVAGPSAIYGFIKTNKCDARWSDWCASHRCDQYGRPLPPLTSDVVTAAAGLRWEDYASSASSMPRVTGQQSPAVSRSSP